MNSSQREGAIEIIFQFYSMKPREKLTLVAIVMSMNYSKFSLITPQEISRKTSSSNSSVRSTLLDLKRMGFIKEEENGCHERGYKVNLEQLRGFNALRDRDAEKKEVACG